MDTFDKVPLPNYSRFEDGVNSFTHALGVPMAFILAVLFLKKLNYEPTGIQTASVIIYTVANIELYFGSAYYHGLKPSRLKKIARVLDHSNIFVMICGILTAFYLFALAEFNLTMAVVLTAASWVIGIIGIVFTVKDLHKFRKIQMAMYIILGWSAVGGMYPIIKNGGDQAKTMLIYVLVGGGLYTLGAVLYGVGKKIRYIHAVFHVFILAATIVQFIGFYNYI